MVYLRAYKPDNVKKLFITQQQQQQSEIEKSKWEINI